MIEGISSTTDNATDVLMINEAYSIDNTEPIYSFMSGRKNYKKGTTKSQLKDTQNELISFDVESVKSVPEGEMPKRETYNPVKELEDFLNGDVNVSIEYARYWHGYLVLLRPLLIFFNITEIRQILFIIFCVLLTWFAILLKKQFGLDVAVVFVYALISIGYFFESYSLQGAPVFLVMMISSLILLKNINKIKDINLFMFIVGCITNFVDYLTVPILTLCIPLIIYMLYKNKTEEMEDKKALKMILKASTAWCVGYAGTWFAKWLIYDLLYDSNLIKSALHQVAFRANGKNSHYGLPFDQTMIYFLTKISIYVVGFITYIYFRECIFMSKAEKKEEIKLNVPTILIGLYPLMWFLVLQNHTTRHLHFSYRNIVVSVIIILICIEKFVRKKNLLPKKELTKFECKKLNKNKSRV